MKKFFAFAMLFAAVSFVACGGGDKKDKENKCDGNCEQCENPCDKANYDDSCSEEKCCQSECEKACEKACHEGECEKACEKACDKACHEGECQGECEKECCAVCADATCDMTCEEGCC